MKNQREKKNGDFEILKMAEKQDKQLQEHILRYASFLFSNSFVQQTIFIAHHLHFRLISSRTQQINPLHSTIISSILYISIDYFFTDEIKFFFFETLGKKNER